jgi:hypothetical protein
LHFRFPNGIAISSAMLDFCGLQWQVPSNCIRAAACTL